jgi:hypothetical protein
MLIDHNKIFWPEVIESPNRFDLQFLAFINARIHPDYIEDFFR